MTLTGTSQSGICSSIADVSCVDIAVATVQDRTRCVIRCMKVERKKKIGRLWEVSEWKWITSLDYSLLLTIYSWLLVYYYKSRILCLLDGPNKAKEK